MFRSIALALVALGLALYLPFSLRSDFVGFDDDLLVTDNRIVHELTPTSIGRAFSSYDPELYVPLTLLTYQIEYAIAGTSPVIYHLTNLALHLLSTVLLLTVLRRLTGDTTAAAVGALLFLIHPLQAEGVLWIAARKDVLSAALGLLSFACFLRWREEGEKRWHLFSVGAFVAALLSKVSIALLPLAFLIVDRRRGRRLDRTVLREYAWYGVPAFILLLVAFGGKSSTLSMVKLWAVPLLAAKSFVTMLQHIVWPTGLSVLYPQQDVVTFSAEFVAYTAGAVIICVLAFVLARRSRTAAIGIMLIAAGILPSMATFAKNGALYYGSDRYAVLPLAGIAVLLAWILARRPRWLHAMTAAVLAIVFIPITFMQAGTWHSTTTLFSRAVAVHPNNALAHNNLGVGLRTQGDVAGAVVEFRRSADLDPTFARPRLNIASTLRELGKNDEALKEEANAVAAVRKKDRLLRDDVNAHAIFAQSLLDVGRTEDALVVMRDAVERAPDLPETHYNLGLTLQNLGRTAEAIPLLRATIELAPRSVEARLILADALMTVGDWSGAQEQVMAVLRIVPGHASALERLANIRTRASEQ